MKKVLLAIAAVATITSCSQNEEFENPTQKAEISFNTAAVTRATGMTTESFNVFKVYGYTHAGDFSTETEGKVLVDGLFNKDVENKWTAEGDKKFYWPAENNVTFFAYSPVEDSGIAYTAPTLKGYPTVDYKVNNTIASQSDFLIAQKTGSIADSESGISLGFKHALTQIAFKLKGSETDVNYSVTKLVLKGIKNSGTYDWGTTKWTIKGDAVTPDYTIDMTGDDAATKFAGGVDAVALTGSDKILMLIPQALAANVATIDVTYTAEQNGTILCDGKTAKTVKIPAIEWVAGQKILYTIALAPGEEINISGAVDDSSWTDGPKPEI